MNGNTELLVKDLGALISQASELLLAAPSMSAATGYDVRGWVGPAINSLGRALEAKDGK